MTTELVAPVVGQSYFFDVLSVLLLSFIHSIVQNVHAAKEVRVEILKLQCPHIIITSHNRPGLHDFSCVH